jgi:hypothetical protein
MASGVACRVLLIEGVASLAVRPSGVAGALDRRSLAAPHVLSVRHGLKMLRVAAGPIPAQMVEFQPGRNVPNEDCESQDVNELGDVEVVADGDDSVSLAGECLLPFPAALVGD